MLTTIGWLPGCLGISGDSTAVYGKVFVCEDGKQSCQHAVETDQKQGVKGRGGVE